MKPAKKRLRPALLLSCVGLLALAWIATTYFRRFQRFGYVDSAIWTVRTVVAGEMKFAEVHPDLGYTCTLTELASDEVSAGLVKNGRNNGYAFEISGCRATDLQRPNMTYQVTARPLHPEMPAFCSDQTGVVRSDESGSVEKCLRNGVPLG